MFDEDVVIVGSGFGGSVAALRLTEKGYRVRVFEAGRRFADEDFAKTSWDVRRYLWAPTLGCFGVQRIHRLPHVMILAGAGVGGGSLNYANTLYEPGAAFFADPQWASIRDWRTALAPHYELVVTRDGHMDNLAVRVEMHDDIHPSEWDGHAKHLQHSIKSLIGISTRIEVVEPGGIARSIGKAKRVQDLRPKA